jgi:hypothetical protein
LVAYWYLGPQGVASDNFERLLKDIQGRLAGRSDRWAYVLMQTEMPEGKEEALARIASLLEGLGESVGLSGVGVPPL